MKINEKIKEFIVPSLVFLFISAIISTDLLITLFFVLVLVLLFFLAPKSKSPLLLRTLSVFILFHFIVFPYLYVMLLKFDSNALVFDSVIEQNEITNAQKEIQENYEIDQMLINKTVVLKLLSSNNSYLDSSFQFINGDNIVFVDSFMLHKTYVYREKGPPIGWNGVSICDHKGQNLTRLKGETNKLTIREFLAKELVGIEEISLNLFSDQKRVDNKEIWSYRRILAYSINIFDTGNLNPKTKLSNLLFFIHKWLVKILLLGIIVTVFYQFLIAKK